MPEPQTTPLDEALDNAIDELHRAKHDTNASMAFIRSNATLLMIALVLRDTRERLARNSRVALTDIEALFKRLEVHNAGAGEAVRLAVSAMLAPLAERIEDLEANPARSALRSLHVNGRDFAVWSAEIESQLSELATTVAGLGTGRAASIADAEREIAKQDRAELDAALSEVARLRAELDDATSRLGLIRNDLSNQQRAARLDNQHLRQRLCQLIDTEYTDHATVPYLLHEIEVRLGAGSDAATRLGDALQRQADAEEQRKTTQGQLDKFTGACGDQAIQIAELRTQLVRMQESHKISHSVANDVSEAEIARLCAERDAALKRCADEIETAMNRCAAATGYPQSNEDWDMVVGQIEIVARNAARMKREHDHVLGQLESATSAIEDLAAFCGVSVESREKCLRGVRRRFASLQSTVAEFKTQSEGRLEQLHQAEMALIDLAGLSIGIDAAKLTSGQCAAAIRAHIESLTEQLAVADADRVPLRMDLDEARGKLERLEPVLKAIHPWHQMVIAYKPNVRPETTALAAAYAEWQDAEHKAQNGDTDPYEGSFREAADNEGARIAGQSDEDDVAF